MRYFVLLLLACALFAEEIETHDMDFHPNPVPWFTGPLLAPSARVVKPGHLKLQMYLNTFVKVGEYNKHWHSESIPHFYSEQLRVQVKFGIFDRVDIQVAPRVVYQWTEGESAFHFGDLPLNLNVQILRPLTLDEGPSLKFSFIANAPVGKFERLNPDKKHTDVSGSGCWFPGLGLNLSQFWYFYDHHYLEIRVTSAYRFGIPVHVERFNAYGDVSGKVYPGSYFIFDTALQYSFTQRWGAACDFRYEHHQRTRSNVHSMKRKAGEEFSLAPAIEYNFSKNIGMIGGVWFTIAGKNMPQFVNGMFSLGIYF